jgi:hypothetical protein
MRDHDGPQVLAKLKFKTLETMELTDDRRKFVVVLLINDLVMI